jgi:hypothetical protein
LGLERNITAKVPVTPDTSKPKSKAKGRTKQPLYVALKAATQKNKQTSKSELTEKIKQEAILEASKTYHVPPLPEEFYENMKRLQGNAFLTDRHENSSASSTENRAGAIVIKLFTAVSYDFS